VQDVLVHKERDAENEGNNPSLGSGKPDPCHIDDIARSDPAATVTASVRISLPQFAFSVEGGGWMIGDGGRQQANILLVGEI